MLRKTVLALVASVILTFGPSAHAVEGVTAADPVGEVIGSIGPHGDVDGAKFVPPLMNSLRSAANEAPRGESSERSCLYRRFKATTSIAW